MARGHALFVFGVVACNGPLPKHFPDASSGGIDAVVSLPDGAPTASGAHHHYVASAVHVPTSANQARTFALDIGGQLSNAPDGAADNGLGNVLSALNGQGFPIQSSIDTSVAHGTTLMLIDLQTDSFIDQLGVGVQTLVGTNPIPAPCNGPSDTVCGHHLDGTGAFEVDASSIGTAATGPITAVMLGGPGVLDASGGTFTIQLGLGAGPTPMRLQNVQTRGTGLSETGLGSLIVDGAVSQDDLNNQFLPGLQSQFVPIIVHDCPGTDPNSSPPCECTPGSSGQSLIGLFDNNPPDCQVTVGELQNNSLIKSLLAPDVCLEASCAKPDALSFGFELVGVPATFTFP